MDKQYKDFVVVVNEFGVGLGLASDLGSDLVAPQVAPSATT